MEVDTQQEERPKTPTQIRRLREEENKERMAQEEKGGSADRRKDHVDDKGAESKGSNEMNAPKVKEIDQEESLNELQINDPSTASLENGNFRDFIFSPKTETISSSSSDLQRNKLKAMM